MAINDVTIQMGRSKSDVSRRLPSRILIAIGATTLVAASVAIAAVNWDSGSPGARPAGPVAPRADTRSITEDLVNRGLIPPESLQPARLTGDDVVRDLVNRGLIPPESLQPARLTGDDVVRDLVNRGLIPRQSLDE